MHSFLELLRRWLTEKQPRKIIEWGPGLSTQTMLEICLTSSIVSIEHEAKWFIKAQELKCPRLELILHNLTQPASRYAVCAFDYGPFDFAFVDGRRRVECALVAMSMLNPGGVVMLHDWCRKEYRVLEYYGRILERKDNTVIFEPRLKRPLPKMVPFQGQPPQGS